MLFQPKLNKEKRIKFGRNRKKKEETEKRKKKTPKIEEKNWITVKTVITLDS